MCEENKTQKLFENIKKMKKDPVVNGSESISSLRLLTGKSKPKDEKYLRQFNKEYGLGLICSFKNLKCLECNHIQQNRRKKKCEKCNSKSLKHELPGDHDNIHTKTKHRKKLGQKSKKYTEDALNNLSTLEDEVISTDLSLDSCNTIIQRLMEEVEELIAKNYTGIHEPKTGQSNATNGLRRRINNENISQVDALREVGITSESSIFKHLHFFGLIKNNISEGDENE